jgi:ribosomal protein S18 acetylase RimI-like enzyme
LTGPLVVRDARDDEYGAVGALTVAAYRALPMDHLWGGYEAQILDTASRAAQARVLVAVDAGRLLGAVTYVDDPDSPWLEWTEPGEAQFRLLAVDPAARGRGAAEALVRACTTIADAAGLDVVIHTTVWMTAAQRLYERLGFQRAPERDVPYDEWAAEPIPDLPRAWNGMTFLAYRWTRERITNPVR